MEGRKEFFYFGNTKAVTECPESRACRTACRPETKNVDEYFFPQHFFKRQNGNLGFTCLAGCTKNGNPHNDQSETGRAS